MNVLKPAIILLAFFIFAGASAQGDPADYRAISDDAGISYVTLDATIPLYVTPDPVYHSAWTAISNNLTAGFAWNFYNDGSWADGDQLDLAVTGNYVEITANTIGSYAINVKEQAPAAYGGCEDPTGRDFTITVIDKPTAAIAGGGASNTWNVVTAGHEYYLCGDALAEDIGITITETGVPAGLASYAYSVQKRVVNIDISDVEQGVPVVTSDFVNNLVSTKYATATANGGSQIVSTGLMPVVGGARTKYEFTISSATDYAGAGGPGIISGISQRSDYLTIAAAGDITTYPFTGTTTVVYIVNPSPVTGPIFHIPNNFNL